MKFKIILILFLFMNSSLAIAEYFEFTGLVSKIRIESDGNTEFQSTYFTIKDFVSAGTCTANQLDHEIEILVGFGPQADRQLAAIIASKLNGTPVSVRLSDTGSFINVGDGRCRLFIFRM